MEEKTEGSRNLKFTRIALSSGPRQDAPFTKKMESSGSESHDETLLLLVTRKILTDKLAEQPYDLVAYLERASVHTELGYPDLAAGDAYRALLLTDEVRDESFEYHDEALEALRSRIEEGIPAALRVPQPVADLLNSVQAASLEDEEVDVIPLVISQRAALQCYRKLAICLLLCGCLRSAYEFCMRGLEVAPQDEDLLFKKDHIQALARRKLSLNEDEEVIISDLPDQGLVRREVYPWNQHEPERFSQESLDFLNSELEAIGAKCEVQATELPTLLETPSLPNGYTFFSTNKQLGLFATEDIQPGETILDEYSVLTVNNRLKESLCDSCSGELPPIGPNSTTVGCPDCDDTMFCGEQCLSRSNEYHSSVCDKDIDTIAKDPDPKETPNALYLLLLARSLAMAETQECHPLDLKEVKYIWGDFLPIAANAVLLSSQAHPPPIWTLPFSFASNISGPLHVLEKMDIDIFATLDKYDLWIVNTLYSKFRGTASARVNRRDGRVEVAAVHPLWCLANHDCDPNVQWEWGGQMRLWCRETRVGGAPGGIKKGEEVLNHYCDIELKYQARREWAKGSLGGFCMCGRCKREEAEEDRKKLNGHGAEDMAGGET
jgi:hypothetical protein